VVEVFSASTTLAVFLVIMVTAADVVSIHAVGNTDLRVSEGILDTPP